MWKTLQSVWVCFEDGEEQLRFSSSSQHSTNVTERLAAMESKEYDALVVSGVEMCDSEKFAASKFRVGPVVKFSV